MNNEYTELWVKDFGDKEAYLYDMKFYMRFEKNIKHLQQIEIIKKYLKKDMKWLDAPIGSGRLMDAIQTDHLYGFDRSPAFLEYNRKKGRTCTEGDLFDMPFDNEFDLITSMHTLFAFDDFRLILKQLIKSLKHNGILITDLVNQSCIDSAASFVKYPYNSGITKEEINEFFSNENCTVIEIIPHDYWDSPYFIRLYKKKWFKPFKLLMKIAYFKLKMAKLFDKWSKNKDEYRYLKYLVVVRKNN